MARGRQIWRIPRHAEIFPATYRALRGRVLGRFLRGSHPPRDPASPFRVANRLHVDCDATVDAAGLVPSNLFSVSLCLQVANFSADGATLRNLRASLVNEWGNHADLLIRRFGDLVDLPPGAIACVEIGRVLVMPRSGSAPARLRAGGWRHEVSSVDAAIAADQEGERRSLIISGNQKMRFAQLRGAAFGAAFTVIISADRVPPFRIALCTNLWADSPYAWLCRVKARDASGTSGVFRPGSPDLAAPAR